MCVCVCVCVCVSACEKFDQFLPARSHFDSKRPEIFARIATFPSATFGPLFFVPLSFICYEKQKFRMEIVTGFAAVDHRSVADKQLHLNGIIHSAGVAQCQELSRKRSTQRNAAITVQTPCRAHYFFHFYCLRLTRLTFNKS